MASPTTTRTGEVAALANRAKTGYDPVYSAAVAPAIGYTPDQLASVPEGSNLGLGCGNPVIAATLRQGEAVLDLGSRGGLDVFLAADQVGHTGIVVGLDESLDMINLARSNAREKGTKPPHVAFIHAPLTEELPIESSSIDCILSNCVMALLPPAAITAIINEAMRVLKPRGRIHLDEIVAKHELPDDMRTDLTNYVNCASGAITQMEYEGILRGAGFFDIAFTSTENDLNIYYSASLSAQQGPGTRDSQDISTLGGTATKPALDANDWIASFHITARKPSNLSVPVSETILKRWWDAYPMVKSSPDGLTADEVSTLIRDPNKTLKDFAVIDVRRNDHAGGHVRGSYQCPAQTFYDDAPGYFERFRNTEKVIFYCQSSNGRGPRCAGWYQDYLDSIGHTSKAFVLTGGVKGWMRKFEGQEDLVDYD